MGVPGVEQSSLALGCPAPFLNLTAPLASASVSTAALSRRDMRLTFKRGTTFGGGGWVGRSRPNLVLDLRRTRVRERSYTELVYKDF
jgi:hypothetical protein